MEKESDIPIILHVARWNEKATKLYKIIGFEVINIEEIRYCNKIWIKK